MPEDSSLAPNVFAVQAVAGQHFQFFDWLISLVLIYRSTVAAVGKK